MRFTTSLDQLLRGPAKSLSRFNVRTGILQSQLVLLLAPLYHHKQVTSNIIAVFVAESVHAFIVDHRQTMRLTGLYDIFLAMCKPS